MPIRLLDRTPRASVPFDKVVYKQKINLREFIPGTPDYEAALEELIQLAREEADFREAAKANSLAQEPQQQF